MSSRGKELRNMTEPELKAMFTNISLIIENKLPAGPSFRGRALYTLLVFDDPGVAHYVSNCRRSDIIKAMRECADRLERNEDIQR